MKGDGNLVDRAKDLEASKVDALCVSTDPGVSPEGIKSLFLISSSVKIPILAKDWFIHPMQILDAKEAGACGMIGIVASVSESGTQLLTGFASALGLDCPVEVLNLKSVILTHSRWLICKRLKIWNDMECRCIVRMFQLGCP